MGVLVSYAPLHLLFWSSHGRKNQAGPIMGVLVSYAPLPLLFSWTWICLAALASGERGGVGAPPSLGPPPSASPSQALFRLPGLLPPSADLGVT